MKILYPIELLLSGVFSFSYNLTGHYGYALILMSVCITLITTPIYLVADYWKNQEKKIQDLMKEDIDCIKAHYSKQKQFYLTQAAHRIYNYKAWYPLRTSLGILIEIPFFFAAFNVLSNFKGYAGVSFGPIQNLGAPDGLLWTVNLLPIVMTLLNVISAIVYSRSFRLRDNTQPFVLAAVFLLFLYDSPSALLIYWSFNNFFSLVKNLIIELTKKNREKFETVNLWQEIKKNRNLVLYILCTMLYIGFTFFMAFDHHKIKYIFLLLSAAQAGLFVYNFIIKRKKLNIRYIITYILYAVFSLVYFKRSHVFDFDTALVIICILNCLLFYFHLRIKPDSVALDKKEKLQYPLLFSLIFTILLPLQIYFVNKLEFPIAFSRISLTLGITFIVAAGIACLLSLLVFKKSNFFLKSLLFILILYFFNGVFLRLNAGMMSEFGFQNDSVIRNPTASLFFKDFITILFAIYITEYLFTKKHNFILPVYIFSIAAFTISIISGVVKYKDVKIEVSNTYKEIPSDTKEIHTFTTTGKNVYIFMSDMMNGNYMGRILEEEPELKETLSGFTWYRDCLSKASDTQTSMQSLYGGPDYSLLEFNKNDITAKQNIQNSIDSFCKPFLKEHWEIAFGQSSVLFEPSKEIKENQLFHIFSDEAYSDYFAKLNSIELKSSSKSFLLQVLPLFQLFPHSSKRYIYQEGIWNNPYLQLSERRRRVCESSSHVELIPQLVNYSDEPINQVKFFPSSITHYPWGYDDELQIISEFKDLELSSEELAYYSSKKSVFLLAELIKNLKENKAYDNTIIIFVSDHGNQSEDLDLCNKDIPQLKDDNYHYHLSMCNTILLIKGFNESGALNISDAQIQNSDIYYYLQEYVFGNSNTFSENLKYTSDNPRERTYSVDLYQKNDYKDLTTVPCVNYSVKGSLFNTESWSIYQ